MPTDTPTAQQLWDQTDNYRREGGPGMPFGMKIGPNMLNETRLFPGVPLHAEAFDNAHAEAILRDHGRTWLEDNGWDVRSTNKTSWYGKVDREHLWDVLFVVEVEKQLVDGETKRFIGEGPTMLSAINAAIGAVLDAKEGK